MEIKYNKINQADNVSARIENNKVKLGQTTNFLFIVDM